MIVLSIDVGLKCSGYIVGKVDNLKINLLKENEIKPRVDKSLAQKLKLIYDNLEKEIISYRPQAVIVERLYSHHKHPTTLGVLSHVRGIVLL
ncbi:MAG: crossover junction endodeoxyribonuclease RuvC, partial [Candidatus Omnitrophica bacterium]|nr:crossover junction endodeoxyribonuclease RuvC [Candidatus Omnitrophota bacterium]